MPGKLRKLIKSKPQPPAFTPENDQSLKRRLSFLSKVNLHHGATTPGSLAGSTVGVPRLSPSPPTSQPAQRLGDRGLQAGPQPRRRDAQNDSSVPGSRVLVRSQSFVADPNQSGATRRTPPTTGPAPAMARRTSSSVENFPTSTERKSYVDERSTERLRPSGAENQAPLSEVGASGRFRRLSHPNPTVPPVIRTTSQERQPPPQLPRLDRRLSNPSFPTPSGHVPQVIRTEATRATQGPNSYYPPEQPAYPVPRAQPPPYQQPVAHRRTSNPSLHVPPIHVPKVSRSDVGPAPPPMTAPPSERPHRYSDSGGRPVYFSSSQPGIPPNGTLTRPPPTNVPPTTEFGKSRRDSGISGVGSWTRGSDLSSRLSSSLPSRRSRTSSQIITPDRSQNPSQLGLPNDLGAKGSRLSLPADQPRQRRTSGTGFIGGFAPFRSQQEKSQVSFQVPTRSNEDERYPKPEPKHPDPRHKRTSSLPSSNVPPSITKPPVTSRTDHAHEYRRTRNQSTHARHASSPSHSRQGSMFPLHDNSRPAYPYMNWHLVPLDQRPSWLVREIGHHGKVGAAQVIAAPA